MRKSFANFLGKVPANQGVLTALLGVFLILASACWGVGNPSSPPPLSVPLESDSSSKRCILLSVPAVSFSDLFRKPLPGLQKWVHRGALGIMNTRVATVRIPSLSDKNEDNLRASAYLTLGAGTRCFAPQSLAQFYTPSEKVDTATGKEKYLRDNLYPPPFTAEERKEGQGLLLPSIELLKEINSKLSYRTDLGILGSLLQGQEVKTGLVGGAGTPKEEGREPALLVMDRSGAVFFYRGKKELLNRDSSGPYGVACDPKAYFQATQEGLKHCRLLVIEWGDTARLDKVSEKWEEQRLIQERERTLQRLDVFLQELEKLYRPNQDLFILLVPYPSRRARLSFDSLTPVVLVDGQRRGILTSATTRRRGVVANTDIAPTILEWFHIPAPTVIVGRPLRAFSSSDAILELGTYRSPLLSAEVLRRRFLRSVVTFLQIFMIFISLFLLKGFRIPLFLWFVIPSLFLSFYLITWFSPFSVQAYSILLVFLWIFSILLSLFIARRVRKPELGLLLSTGLLTLSVFIDGFQGFPRLPFTLLSYSLIEGARYYGIGNEWMGAFLASSMLAATLPLSIREAFGGKLFAFSVLLLSLAVLGGPSWGAKFGGILSSSFGLGVLLLLLMRTPFRLKHFLLLLLIVLSGVALVVIADLHRGGASSHIALAFQGVRQEGFIEFWRIVVRKASMNLRLFLFSPWSRLLLWAFLASLLCLWRRRLAFSQAWRRLAWRASFCGLLAVIGTATLLNDAGVLAGATALVYLPSFLGLSLEEDTP